jgi:hypothetical protein
MADYAQLEAANDTADNFHGPQSDERIAACFVTLSNSLAPRDWLRW